MAVGLQDGFDWGAVAIAGISAFLTAGIGGKLGLATKTPFVRGALQGIVSNTVGQGVNMAFGRQDQFDWKGMAVSGLAGGANGYLDGKIGASGATTFGGLFGQGVANGLRRGIVSNAVEYIVRGEDDYKARGGFDAQGLMTSVVGNALADAITETAAYNHRAGVIASQYDQMVAERRGSVGDAEGRTYRENQIIGEQYANAMDERYGNVGDAEGASNYRAMQEQKARTMTVTKDNGSRGNNSDPVLPDMKEPLSPRNQVPSVEVENPSSAGSDVTNIKVLNVGNELEKLKLSDNIFDFKTAEDIQLYGVNPKN
jgi:hypothetical protein